MDNIVEVVKTGGVVVYPTETLYALGCSGRSHMACERVVRIKNRPYSKPLPLIIGSLDQLRQITDSASDDVMTLARAFWPGPLSVLVPALPSLSSLVMDDQGYTSVRFSPHPVASGISLIAGVPLVATSANISGESAQDRPDRLSEEVLSGADAAFLDMPLPGGGLPSTVVRPLGDRKLLVLRCGAVRMEALEFQGFSCLS